MSQERITKIDKMHYLYGKGIRTCKECNRLKCYEISDRNRRVYKCLNYGESSAESTDWRLSYEACGMKDKVADKPAIKIYVANKEKLDPVKNQISLFDIIDEKEREEKIKKFVNT